MDAHREVRDLLGAWAIGACDEDETTLVEAHIPACPLCAGEAERLRAAADLLVASRTETPPRGVRLSLLAEARRRRPPEPSQQVMLGRLVDAYARQVALLDNLLSSLGNDGWRLPCPRHETVCGMVSHLTANDTMLATELGLPAGGAGRDPHVAWRTQADVLVRELSTGTGGAAEVQLAGPSAIRRPLRDAVVQRAFETWTHLDDISVMVGRPVPPPPPDHIRHVVDFAVALLPEALAAGDDGAADGTVRLALTGDAGDEWTFPLRPAGSGPEVLTLTADAVDFCRLAANRYPPAALPHRADGDRRLAQRVLRAAARLGCD
jgi:uncharacterized protein (TIGR03083 family)